MRVLITETQAGDAKEHTDALVAAGHEVLRCREVDGPAFPCAALVEGETCPVETGVDVVLDVRRRSLASPSPREDGTVCGIRHLIPLVVEDQAGLNPFREWTSVVVTDGDVVGACEKAAAMDIEPLTKAATAVVRRTLGVDEDAAPGVGAAVHRAGDRLSVRLSLPPGLSEGEAHRVGIRAAGEVRRLDPYDAKIDVSY